MNFKDFPVLSTDEFEHVMIDVTKWGEHTYTATFGFFKQYGNEKIKQAAEGFALCTYLDGETLHELYEKIDTIVELGLFNGVEISAHGHLFNEVGEIIDDIDWNAFSDSTEDFDITHELIHTASKTIH